MDVHVGFAPFYTVNSGVVKLDCDEVCVFFFVVGITH